MALKSAGNLAATWSDAWRKMSWDFSLTIEVAHSAEDETHTLHDGP